MKQDKKKMRAEGNERTRNKRIEKQMNSSKPPKSPNRFIHMYQIELIPIQIIFLILKDTVYQGFLVAQMWES